MLLGLLASLLAENPPAPAPDGGSPFGMLIIPMLLLLFVFIVWLPQRRQEKQRVAQLSTLKKNDKIINSGGIIGIVDVVKDNQDEIILRGGVRITKSSVQRIVPPDDTSKS
jgi:preprotein translocase subunit YajC